MGFASNSSFDIETAGQGVGTPLLLIHGAFTSQACRPLACQPQLTTTRRVIHYCRRGYGRTPAPPAECSIADQAADARAVLTSLGIERAHVLGHSIGSIIALQLALDAPDLVESLVLVDPTFVTHPERLQEFEAEMTPAFEAYAAGDRARTVHEMYAVLDGESYRGMLDTALGEAWFHEAVSTLDLYFQAELPRAVTWRLPTTTAAKLTLPIMAILGREGPEVFKDIFDDVLSILPRATGVVLPDASHNVIACCPDHVGEILERFFAHNDAGTPVTS
jgi:pimeloyl-ACP methyl ester carboxylesterase